MNTATLQKAVEALAEGQCGELRLADRDKLVEILDKGIGADMPLMDFMAIARVAVDCSTWLIQFAADEARKQTNAEK